MKGRNILLVISGLLLVAVSGLAMRYLVSGTEAPPATAIPFAVLGDSDSHAYQDTIRIPLESGKRGGANRANTFQWTEILARLRGDSLYQGRWGAWGTPIKIAEFLDWLGVGGRTPRKLDFRYNFAVSSAGCDDLMTGYYRQAPRLLTEMSRASDVWKRGIVMIQIGVNTMGQSDAIARYAKSGATAEVIALIGGCVERHRQAIQLIAAAHPQTRFIVAGIFDNADLAGNVNKWTSPEEIRNISATLDLFDSGLKQLAASQPNVVFIDARDWFHSHWGSRNADGKPAYRSVNLGGAVSVTNTSGDAPYHAILADNHGGTVYNALWANRVIVTINATLNATLGTKIPLLTTAEIARLADPSGSFGLR